MTSATIPLHAEFHYGGPLRGRPPDVRETTKLSLRGSPALDHGPRSTASPPHSDFHYGSLRSPRAQAVVQLVSLHRHAGEQKKPMKNSVSWFSSPRPSNPKQDDSTKLFSTRRWRATVVEFRVWWIFVASHCFLWTRRGRATVVEFRVLRTRVTSGAHRGRELL